MLVNRTIGPASVLRNNAGSYWICHFKFLLNFLFFSSNVQWDGPPHRPGAGGHRPGARRPDGAEPAPPGLLPDVPRSHEGGARLWLHPQRRGAVPGGGTSTRSRGLCSPSSAQHGYCGTSANGTGEVTKGTMEYKEINENLRNFLTYIKANL